MWPLGEPDSNDNPMIGVIKSTLVWDDEAVPSCIKATMLQVRLSLTSLSSLRTLQCFIMRCCSFKWSVLGPGGVTVSNSCTASHRGPNVRRSRTATGRWFVGRSGTR